MKGERILIRKFEKINSLKKELVSRGHRDNKDLVNDIKEVTEDLEAILFDLGYLNDKPDGIFIDGNDVRTYRCFRDNAEFTLKDLEKYNGKDGMPLYVAIDNNVYDISELIDNRDDIERVIEEVKSNKELLSNYVVVGTIVVNN